MWGSDPVSPDARADYFDSLFHSAVVVGLNTSAFIEAGILGRPVHTILLPEWYESQMGTVHFRYLFEAGGGLLTSATSFDEHLQQLDEVLAHPSTEVRPFVRAFVRPRGLDVAATPVFVEHVETMKGLAGGAARPAAFRGPRAVDAEQGTLVAARRQPRASRLLGARAGGDRPHAEPCARARPPVSARRSDESRRTRRSRRPPRQQRRALKEQRQR